MPMQAVFEVADPLHIRCQRDGSTLPFRVQVLCTTPDSHAPAPYPVEVSDRGKLSADGVQWGAWGETLYVGEDVYSAGVWVWMIVRPPDATGALRYTLVDDLLTLAQDTIVPNSGLSIAAVFSALSGVQASATARLSSRITVPAVSATAAGGCVALPTAMGSAAVSATVIGRVSALLATGVTVGAVAQLLADAGIQGIVDLSAAATFAAQGDFTAAALMLLPSGFTGVGVSDTAASLGLRPAIAPQAAAATISGSAKAALKLRSAAVTHAASCGLSFAAAKTEPAGDIYFLLANGTMSAGAPAYDWDILGQILDSGVAYLDFRLGSGSYGGQVTMQHDTQQWSSQLTAAGGETTITVRASADTGYTWLDPEQQSLTRTYTLPSALAAGDKVRLRSYEVLLSDWYDEEIMYFQWALGFGDSRLAIEVT